MKIKYVLSIILFLVFFSLPAGAGNGGVMRSTVDDQTAVEVTVYNDNIGFVKETREVKLAVGQGELQFMDVPAGINPVTVHVKSINLDNEFSILEQNYEYDLMNRDKLLDKYVGKQIRLINWNQYQDRKEIAEATLLSNNQGQIYKINDEVYLGHPGIQVLPRLPENLIAKPTLTWLYQNKSAQPHRLEVSYLTENLTWKADYVLLLNESSKTCDISGWVTIDNKSGATYNNAVLTLIAGKIHRAERPHIRSILYAKETAPYAADNQFEESGIFEYHAYDLQRQTTLKDRQTKQISLLNVVGTAIQKEFLVYGMDSYFTGRYSEALKKQPVNVYVKFRNTEENHLGVPLPSGIMRLYTQDSKGKQHFIGEDRIDHVPRNEEVKLKIGEAFDIVAERIQTDFQQLTSRLYESAWEITLRNHKDSAVTVGLVEPMFGNWQIIESSHRYTKLDAMTIRFDIPVDKDGETKVRYRARVGLQ